MTKKQTALYWRTWNKVRIELISKGFATTETADQNRHEIHIKALGYDASSKSLTNDEFDRVLAQFLAIASPSDLTAQLDKIDQAYRRFEFTAQGLIRATGEVGPAGVSSYFIAMCNRVGKGAPEHLDQKQRSKVIAALNIHRKRALKRTATACK